MVDIVGSSFGRALGPGVAGQAAARSRPMAPHRAERQERARGPGGVPSGTGRGVRRHGPHLCRWRGGRLGGRCRTRRLPRQQGQRASRQDHVPLQGWNGEGSEAGGRGCPRRPGALARGGRELAHGCLAGRRRAAAGQFRGHRRTGQPAAGHWRGERRGAADFRSGRNAAAESLAGH